jgi:hypothetical protein
MLVIMWLVKNVIGNIGVKVPRWIWVQEYVISYKILGTCYLACYMPLFIITWEIINAKHGKVKIIGANYKLKEILQQYFYTNYINNYGQM